MAEEIIWYQRTIEIEMGKGLALAETCRKLSITEQLYYRCKKEYGDLRVDQWKRMKRLEHEHAHIKPIRRISHSTMASQNRWRRNIANPGPTPRIGLPGAGNALSVGTSGVLLRRAMPGYIPVCAAAL